MPLTVVKSFGPSNLFFLAAFSLILDLSPTVYLAASAAFASSVLHYLGSLLG